MNQITNKHVVMTLAEAAKFLRVKKAVLQNLVDDGKVPARKIGAEWRFFRGALEAWLAGEPDPDLAMLRQAGMFKDDPDLPGILADIYKSRGRPECEDG